MYLLKGLLSVKWRGAGARAEVGEVEEEEEEEEGWDWGWGWRFEVWRYDEPAAHLMTSGSNMEQCAKTHLCLWSHILSSAERGCGEEKGGVMSVYEMQFGSRRRNVRASGCA